MAIVVLGVCKICNDGAEQRLISRAKGICLNHYRQQKAAEAIEKAKQQKKEKGYSGISRFSEKGKKVSALDQKFYEEIWKKRPHKSEVSGDPLPDKMERWYMSHILPKGNYPRFRHEEVNVLLMTKEEHFIWEFGMPTGEQWEKVKILRKRLQEMYNRMGQMRQG
jgi:hypothetical protein